MIAPRAKLVRANRCDGTQLGVIDTTEHLRHPFREGVNHGATNGICSQAAADQH